jgi:hypothetical protein
MRGSPFVQSSASTGVAGGSVATDAVWTAANQVAVSSASATAAALTMGASTILARLAAGNVVAATPAQLKTLLAITPPESIRAVSVAYAATVTPNADTTDVLNIGALTGALSVGAPTGTPVDGQKMTIRLLQDGTGGRVITWNAAFAFGTDITAAMEPTAASSKWERVFEWNATDSKWRNTGLVRGF